MLEFCIIFNNYIIQLSFNQIKMEGGNKSLKSLIEAEMRSKKIVENAQQAQSEKLNKASLEAQKLVQDYQMKLDEAYEAEKQRVSPLKSLIRSVER
jgi:hypothetical protein